MKKRALLISIIVLHLFLPTLSFAVAFSDLYVFGDSLSDSGQFPDIFAGYSHLRATNRIDPSDPYSETARVWSQYFSEDLSLGQLLPSDPWFDPSGNNYAVVTYTSDKILSTIQDRYLAREANAKASALYVIWGGGNDLRHVRNLIAAGGGSGVLMSESKRATDYIVSGVQALGKAGARYVLVPNLPNIGDIPESYFLGSAYIKSGNEATRIFNNQLLSGLNLSGINVIQADINALFNEIMDSPAGFGFSDENHKQVAFDGDSFTGIPAIEGANGIATNSADPSRYIFFDGIHPTTYAADIISQYYISILEAPGQRSILAEIPLSLARAYTNAIDRHLKQVQSSDLPKKIIPFISGGHDLFQRDDTPYGPGFENKHYGLTSGFSYLAADHWNIGAAAGHYTGKIQGNQNSGKLDINAHFLSLLTGYRHGRLDLYAIMSIADLNYNDIIREISIGPLSRSHMAETDGDYRALKLSASYDLLNRTGLSFGYLASLNYQRIHVDGHEENGNLSTSMKFYDQHRNSFLVKTGLFVTYDIDTMLCPMQIRSDFGYEKEFKDEQKDLRSGLVTLPGSSFDLPLSYPEKYFWPFNLEMGFRIATDIELNISYHLTIGSEISKDQGAQISIRISF